MSTRNRGKEASDDRLFGTDKMKSKLQKAVNDMSFLLSRGYAEKSSVQLVGNRYRLNARQQRALQGMSASNEQVSLRKEKSIPLSLLKDQHIEIDGFNLIIILESTLSDAYLFKGLDGFYRDQSSVHGTYKRVKQTDEALLLVGHTLNEFRVKSVKWYLDAPVSNSGRLKVKMHELASEYNFNWEIELVNSPDKELAQSKEIIISSDGWILDQAKQNFNLGAYLIEEKLNNSNIIYSK